MVLSEGPPLGCHKKWWDASHCGEWAHLTGRHVVFYPAADGCDPSARYGTLTGLIPVALNSYKTLT